MGIFCRWCQKGAGLRLARSLSFLYRARADRPRSVPCGSNGVYRDTEWGALRCVKHNGRGCWVRIRGRGGAVFASLEWRLLGDSLANQCLP